MRSMLALILCGILVLGLAGCRRANPGDGTPRPTAREEGVRRPAVAGDFYPEDPAELAGLVDSFLQDRKPTPGRPIALIVPHAGYPYSGRVAAAAYAELRGQQYDAVILIGPNHYLEDFFGVAVYAQGSFETPLGPVPVDAELAGAILKDEPGFEDDLTLHAREHSLEVQLPFLQRVLPGTPIVPILIGQPTPENLQALTKTLTRVLAGRNVLLIASSDLSHYPVYEDAVQVDRSVLSAIETLDVATFLDTLNREMAQGIPNLLTPCCGEGAIVVVMEVARALGADRVSLLEYANSGDVPAGERDRVVGYGAMKFWASRASP